MNVIVDEPSAEEPELSSFVGGSNKIVGGVTLYLTRKARKRGAACKTYDKWAKLNAPCFPDDDTITDPFGVDPVASPFHEMFNPNVAAELGAFYDTTADNATTSPELVPKPGTKLPHAFYSDSVPGFEPGYFAYFDTKLPLARVKDQLLKVLTQGRFLRPDTVQSLKMIVVTWNAELEVFGRVEVNFQRDEGGSIEASTKVEVLADYRVNRPDVAVGIVGQLFKLLMVAGFLVHTVAAINKETSRSKGVGWRTGANLRFLKGVFLYYGKDMWHGVDTLVDMMVLVTQSMWWTYVNT